MKAAFATRHRSSASGSDVAPTIKVSKIPQMQPVPATAVDEVVSETGRRRPGRLKAVNPKLLPLLRQTERDQLVQLRESAPVPSSSNVLASEQVAPSSPFLTYENEPVWFGEGEGTALGVFLGSLLWASIATGAWALFH